MANSTICDSIDCPGVFFYQPPTLAGNVVLLALFAILVPLALAVGIRYKGLCFAGGVSVGLTLEVVGYVGRLLLRNDVSSRVGFVVFLAGTTLGPTCICGAMFSIVPRIVTIYGEEYRSWRPVWYFILFSVLTVLSFSLELAGSVVSTTQDTPDMVNIGNRLLVAGLAVQLIALVIFAVHATLFSIALRTRQHGLDPEFSPIYRSRLFISFLFGFTTATILVVVRTAYRTVQIAEGFKSSIAQTETPFLVLDGAFVFAAAVLLLAFFPARAFGRSWSEISIQLVSREQQRPIYFPGPVQSPVAYPSQNYNPMSTKPPISTSSPRKANFSAPSSQRDMVDSDNLW
ncbi:RTA1 like protein-domain-containing protein [Nemania sp. FL0031]|nr:RTA1 like protein-domain-containing protein [Nemania sp. FL0031]